jgi:hypothetical protein
VQTRQQGCLFLLYGLAGIGKSCLLHRLRQTCQNTNTLTPFLDFRTDASLTQPERIIQQLRLQIGGVFNERLAASEKQIRQNVQQQTVQSAFSQLAALPVGGGVAIHGSQVEAETIVGGNQFNFNNSPLVFNPSQGDAYAHDEMLLQWNLALRQALKALVASQPLILFLDHLDEANPTVLQWVNTQLLRLFMEDGVAFRNMLLVVAGRHFPFLYNGLANNVWLKAEEIGPLSERFIRQFWVEKMLLDASHLPTIIPVSGGVPQLLFMMARNLELAQEVHHNGDHHVGS